MAIESQCSLLSVAVTDGCGCSATRASITGVTPNDIEAWGTQEIGGAMLLRNALQAKMAGYQENTLEMLLRSRIKDIRPYIQKEAIMGAQSVIKPYFHKLQKRHLNENYWSVISGAADPGAGSNGRHPGSWQIIVGQNQSTYSTPIPALEGYFLPGSYLLVEFVNTTTKAKYSAQFKVISAANADSGGVSRAQVTIEPGSVTAAGWAGYTSGQKAAFQPTAGLVIPLHNSVKNYESWCHNEKVNNPNQFLTFWPQTVRETYCYNDEHLEYLNAALNPNQTNTYLALFKELPLAEQNKQRHRISMKKLMNTAFYGQPISEHQTSETYRSLPGVYDPADPSCLLEYKSNAKGFRTQLQDCSRFADFNGEPLNLDTLFGIGDDVLRARAATGESVDRIDIGVDRWTFGNIQQAMHSFYKAKYGTSDVRYYEPNQALVHNNQVMLKYDVFQVPQELGGYELAMYTHPAFDDKIRAAGAGDLGNSQRSLWMLDFSDTALGVGSEISKKRETDVYDNLYNCTIEQNVTHYQLQSQQICPMIEDPLRHYLIENFSDACPVLSVSGCSV